MAESNAPIGQISLLGKSNNVPKYDGGTSTLHNFISKLGWVSIIAEWTPETTVNMTRVILVFKAQVFVDYFSL